MDRTEGKKTRVPPQAAQLRASLEPLPILESKTDSALEGRSDGVMPGHRTKPRPLAAPATNTVKG
jgi:hypothetical protein